MAYTFIISDESKNSHGFIVKTNGIDLNRFKSNPIMLYMHERKNGVIGRWENIRVDGSKVLADAVFDESEELGKRIKEKVEKGFLNTASISLAEPIVWENIGGVDTVTRCALSEVSIVDIPANKNAVKLMNKKGKYVYNLSELEPMTEAEFIAELLSLLDLDETADEYTVLDKIRAMKSNSVKDTGKDIEKSFNMGFITDGEQKLLLKMNENNQSDVLRFLENKKSDSESVIDNIVSKANKDGKIIVYDKRLYKDIGMSIGAKQLKQLFAAMPTQVRITDLIDGGKHNSRSNWGLNEYRKYAPDELKKNPQLYRTLIDREKDNTSLRYDLDYYRKNDPQFLKDNPEEYARLLKEYKQK